ncbi:MAG: NTP transferase domain-containing protein [Nocardioides sp.]
MTPPFCAVVLAGGTAVRMDGVDKAGIEYAGRTLLEHVLAALADATEVVVVGDEVPTSRPVSFVREQPAYGGPAAGLFAGRDALLHPASLLAVVAVDMPRLTPATFGRLWQATEGYDGAFLTDEDGRRQLVGVLRLDRLDAVRPGDVVGLPLHRLLGGLDMAEVPSVGAEARDVDTWSDLRDLGELPDVSGVAGVAADAGSGKSGPVNLHDWIDELCDALDIETEVDEALILDLAKVTADNVVKVAAPITSYLLGYAAGEQGADPADTEALAARAQVLAEGWDRPADAPDPDDITDEIPDDSAVDHSHDTFED